MRGSGVAQRVLEALEKVAADHGVDVVDVELAGPRSRPCVRVRIDALDEGAPMDMDRIAKETPWVSEVVEELDPFDVAYDLEVSSPGLARPLRRMGDFVRFAGETVEVKLVEPAFDRRAFVGTVVAAADDEVVFDVDGESHAVAFDNIQTARIKPDFERIMAEAKRAARERGDE